MKWLVNISRVVSRLKPQKEHIHDEIGWEEEKKLFNIKQRLVCVYETHKSIWI